MDRRDAAARLGRQEAVEQMATLDRVSYRAANAIPFDRRKRRVVASHRWQTTSAFWAASSMIAWPRRCLFMAQNGRGRRVGECPLSGEEQTSNIRCLRSAFDPKRKLATF
jgi:hypothetical protein